MGENIFAREERSKISTFLKNNFNTLNFLINEITRKPVEMKNFVRDIDYSILLTTLKRISDFEVKGERIIDLDISKKNSTKIKEDKKKYINAEEINTSIKDNSEDKSFKR